MAWLFAQNPDQWALLRQRPDLIPNAINEVLRIEAVIHAFSRCTTEQHDVEGISIPANARVLMVYASANRDERHFPNAATFDIERANAGDHLSLGYGSHERRLESCRERHDKGL
jgi:cytochrome P450